jgi:hypothetical protein
MLGVAVILVSVVLSMLILSVIVSVESCICYISWRIA